MLMTACLTQSALVHVPLLERQQPEQLFIHHHHRRPRDLVACERALINETFLPSISSRAQSEIKYAQLRQPTASAPAPAVLGYFLTTCFIPSMGQS